MSETEYGNHCCPHCMETYTMPGTHTCKPGYQELKISIAALTAENITYRQRAEKAEAELAKEKSLRGSIESSHFRLSDSGTVAIGTCGTFDCYPCEDDMVKIKTNNDLRGVYFDKFSIQKLIILLGQIRNYMWRPLPPADITKPTKEEPRAGGVMFCDKCNGMHAAGNCPKPVTFLPECSRRDSAGKCHRVYVKHGKEHYGGYYGKSCNKNCPFPDKRKRGNDEAM